MRNKRWVVRDASAAKFGHSAARVYVERFGPFFRNHQLCLLFARCLQTSIKAGLTTIVDRNDEWSVATSDAMEYR
jgi:hypothetical protein